MVSGAYDFKQRDHSTLGLLSAGLEFKQRDHCQLGAYMNEFDTLFEPPVVSNSFRMKLPPCRRDVCNRAPVSIAYQIGESPIRSIVKLRSLK